MSEEYGTATLQTIRVRDLQKRMFYTQQQLLEVCINAGFFYLGVEDDENALNTAMRYFMDFTTGIFDLCEEEKKRYPFQTTGRGNNTSGYAQNSEAAEPQYPQSGLVKALDSKP